MNKPIVLALGAAILFGGAGWYFTQDGRALQACETELKENLKAPSTYKLVEKEVSHEEEYHCSGTQYAASTQEQLKAAGCDKQTVTTISLTYDAENSFGAPLRGTSICRFEPDGKAWLMD